VTVATTPYYRQRADAIAINFRSIRPDRDQTDSDLIRKCADLKKGSEVLCRKMLLLELRGTCEDLLSVARDADLPIAGELVYAAPPLVAEKLRLPWASVTRSPSIYPPFWRACLASARHWTAAQLGRVGDSFKSNAKTAAVRENGKLGRRPRSGQSVAAQSAETKPRYIFMKYWSVMPAM
jgi:hypothetical protein